MESFGYTMLQIPIESLIISYPIEHLDEALAAQYVKSKSPPPSPLEQEQLEPEKEQLEPEKEQPTIVKKKQTRRKPSTTTKTKNSPKHKTTRRRKSKDDDDDDDDKQKKVKTVGKPRNSKKKNNQYITDIVDNVVINPTLNPITSVIVNEVVELTQKPSSEKSISSYEYVPIVKGVSTFKKDSNSSIIVGGATTLFISPNDLIGSKGLGRMMEYVDTRSPPEKGSFSYRETTLNTFGKIFSQSEIGKYSSKIDNICKSIHTSEGILLIYSQYIDGGLIPIALALEEMGFTRYGQNVKSLFKTPPTDIVDARTMKTKREMVDEGRDFIPARYCMITGDPRISPNNDYEVKAATDEGNKDGYKIRVILISKAGSEGLDFKFIRQVHVLEPWYNMNRIEQIFGRAVRNFSHKDLPFEKRNVELFMYATLLGQGSEGESNEEAADMYVYRVAEHKSIQIGKITRILKETAVDSILNHEQTNFTQQKMARINKRGVKQILSSGLVLDNFKVGDTPYSSACDYMKTCEFKCIPTKEIGDENIKLDTYNEVFIMLNSEKIIKKVHMLMKERFFYIKSDLIRRINTPKPYPLVQIYAALTQIIDNTTEFIVDKYGRTGYLVNIGEYYLFQPSELSGTPISIFERSVPIDFKHNKIDIVNDTDNMMMMMMSRQNAAVLPLQEQQVEEKGYEAGPVFMSELKTNYELTIQFITSPELNVPRGDDNWYKYCGVSIRKMIADGITDEETMTTFVVEHLVDLLMFDDKLVLLQYLYNNTNKMKEGTLEWKMKRYMDSKLVHTKRFTGIILVSQNTKQMFILRGNLWNPAEPEDEREMNQHINSDVLSKKRDPNNIIGFIGLENKNKYLTFKIKQMDMKRNTGARCDEAVKSKKILFLNLISDKIEGRDKYVDAVLTPEEKTAGFVSTKGLVQAELCSLLELLFRKYNKDVKDGKMWFVDYEMATIYGL